MKKAVTPRRMGRPLSFDREAVLDKAMLAFWRTGYETTSVAELSTAMGITVPSIYTAFGDKRRLFLEALTRYGGDASANLAALADAASSLDAARIVLEGAALRYTGEGTPAGCLMASSTATGSDAAADVRAEVAGVRAATTEALRARIARDIDEEMLPQRTNPTALAQFVLAVVMGLSVLARDGGTRTELMAVVEQTLGAWPRRQNSA